MDRLAAVLCEQRVSRVFGIPGSGLSLRLITALERLHVPFDLASHEAAAVLMVGSFARASNTLGCAIAIKGPGVANQFPGIVANHFEQIPVLTISEAYSPADSSGRVHKKLSHREILSPVVRAYAAASDAASLVPRLASAAFSEVPGPVHLDLHSDSSAPDIFSLSAQARSPTPDALADVLSIIRAAARPVVIAGSLGLRRTWAAALSTTRVPVFTTVAAKGLIDERSCFSAGIFTGDGGPSSPEEEIIAKADVVIGLGLRTMEVLTPKAGSASLVLLDEVSPEHSSGFKPSAAVWNATERCMLDVLEAATIKEWGAELAAECQQRVRERLTADSWLPGRVIATLQSRLAPDTAIVVDTGLFCTVTEHVWRSSPQQPFWGSANGRYMGTALPSAIGAAIFRAPRTTLCVVGDGGIGMYLGDLALAVRRRLPLIIVFMCDGTYASVAGAPSAAGLLRSATTPPRSSWYAVAAALGCDAARVSDVTALERVLDDWAGRRPLFVEAVFDTTAYTRMTEGLR